MNRRLVGIGVAVVVLFTSVGWGFLRSDSSSVAMQEAANKFTQSLTDDQRKIAVLDYDTPKRVDWHFIPKPERKGLQIRDMNEDQRKAAHTLLRSALSQIGYDKAVKIMSLEIILKELEKSKTGAPLRDSERYYFTIFGKPADAGRWGLSIEGHHLSLNFVVENGKVISSTPTVFATNPATVKNEITGGQPKGTRLLAKEEQLAFDLVNSLTAEQLKTAVIDQTAPKDIRAAGEPQPPQTPPVGIPSSKLTADQQKTLQGLIDSYAENLPEPVAQDRWAAIRAGGLDGIHFAWAGAKNPGIGHYYRIQGTTFLIEFVNTQPDSAGNPANHIHSIWRDMRGDFAIPISPAKGG